MIENAKHGGTQLTKEELSIASHSLTFGDKLVSDVYVPMSVVRTVPLDLALSAVAMSELYDTGYSRFPVIGSSPGTYIGVLYTKDLALLGANKNVSEAMRPEVYYVNEQSSLIHVLNGFIRTKHHLYMVVNEFEEVSGIVTIEDVIEQIIGRKIVDEFDKYDDLRAVARQLAHDTAKSRAGTTA